MQLGVDGGGDVGVELVQGLVQERHVIFLVGNEIWGWRADPARDGRGRGPPGISPR